MMEIVLLRALVAGCTLRRLIDSESPVSRHVSEAMAQLVFECEQLLDDPQCLVPVAVLQQGIDAYRDREDRSVDVLQGTLRRLLSRLWARLELERSHA